MLHTNMLPDTSQDAVELAAISLVVALIAVAFGVVISPWWFVAILLAILLLGASASLS